MVKVINNKIKVNLKSIFWHSHVDSKLTKNVQNTWHRNKVKGKLKLNYSKKYGDTSLKESQFRLQKYFHFQLLLLFFIYLFFFGNFDFVYKSIILRISV